MSSSTTDQGLVDVTMPQMGTSMSEGTIIAWLKAVGDEVAADESICEISTDKIDTECPSPAAGTLVEILAEVEETVEVGAVLARISVAGGAPALAAPADSGAEPAAAPPPEPAANGADGLAPRPADSRRYSPLVRRIAAEHGVDLTRVPGTGRGDRVTKKDLLAWLEQGGGAAAEPPLHSDSPYRPDPEPAVDGAATPAASAPPTDLDQLGGVSESLSRIRRSIGGAMLRSQQTTATCHTVVECDFSGVERRRRELGVTALPLVARATIDVIRRFPDLNATLDGDTVTRFGERVHLGIAVSLGEEGLIVPVIHDAQDLSAEGIAARIRDLARRARSKQLQPDDVAGASFTITSPGAFGATIATPVINAPQVGILDMEAIVKRPVVVTDENGQDSIAIRPMANFVLGWDHRAMDGVYAAQFLGALRDAVE
ncbi:MAG: dehydrogenase [Solirubrobacterales bacterium 70-9]|nr:MAG: dehydrogenase [Solirubrobacterales bacterium 70-9]